MSWVSSQSCAQSLVCLAMSSGIHRVFMFAWVPLSWKWVVMALIGTYIHRVFLIDGVFILWVYGIVCVFCSEMTGMYTMVRNSSALINSLGPIVDISIMRLSASWCHFRQCPWDRLGFCVSRKGGTGGCGWVHSKACPRLGSSLEATWLALGGPFLSILA